MVKVSVWRTGRKKGCRGSLAVVIPIQLAEAREITEGMKLDCRIDLDHREIVYRKKPSFRHYKQDQKNGEKKD